jgi:hypothetical protein
MHDHWHDDSLAGVSLPGGPACDSAESRRAGPLARHPIMMIIGSSAAAGPRPVSRLGATVQCPAVATVTRLSGPGPDWPAAPVRGPGGQHSVSDSLATSSSSRSRCRQARPRRPGT